MLKLLSIKTLFRTPLKTLLTFLLLTATSYMLFFSAAEYTATSRERERAIAFYQGTGAVEAAPAQNPVYPVYGMDVYLYTDERVAYNPYGEEARKFNYAGLSQADIDAVGKLPYVTKANVRYMTAGVSESLTRADYRDDYYNYTARLITEITLADNESMVEQSAPGEYSLHPLDCRDFTVLAGGQGNRDSLRVARDEGKTTAVMAYEFSSDNADGFTASIGGNMGRAFIIVKMGESYYNEIYSHDFLSSLVPGERYVIICRCTLGFGPVHSYYLTDPATVGGYPQIYPLKGQPDNYLELDTFAPLRELIEITNADLHTFDIVYTGDMSSIMRFAEKNMLITAGRMLTDEDSANRNNVCVMNERYIAQNGLKIGDRITLKLGDKLFEQNAQLGAVAVVPERYADNFTEETFEIVGAYRDVDTHLQQAATLNWSYSANTIFVPQSFLPVEVPDDHVVKPGEFSFVIDDPRNISAFMAEARPIIEDKLGLTLVFTDGGWSELEGQINRSVTLAAVRFALLCFCVLVAIILTVYLFIGRKRKEYAVMRALGTPFKRANRSLSIPLAVLGVFALAAGNIFGYTRVGSRLEEVLAPLAQPGVEPEAAVPAYLIFICFASVFAALAFVTAYMLYRIGKKPPLELLQAGMNRNAAKERARGTQDQITQAVSVSCAAMPVRDVPEIKTPAQTTRKYSAARHVSSYIARHIRRTPAKALFALGLALLLIGTIGQLTVIRGVYKGLYENLEVKAYILDDGITVENAIEVAASRFIKAFYAENTSLSLACHNQNLRVIMSNDIMCASAGAAETEFLNGYDGASFNRVNPVAGPANICVMESGLMQSLGVKLGDTVRIHSNFILAMLIKDKFGIQTSVTGPELERMLEIFEPTLDKLSVFYTVVGRASGIPANTVYVPIKKGLFRFFSKATHSWTTLSVRWYHRSMRKNSAGLPNRKSNLQSAA
jgi:hypothetical protein